MSLYRITLPPDDKQVVTLRMTGRQHDRLYNHLYPGDAKEAVALILCGRCLGEQGSGPWGSRHILTVHEIFPVPYDACHERTPIRVSWPTSAVMPAIEKAANRGFAVLKVHSHPTDYKAFSKYDDVSDGDLFPSVMGWTDDGGPHASAVMLPDGGLFGRAAYDDGRGSVRFRPIDTITVVGDEIRTYLNLDVCSNEIGTGSRQTDVPEYAKRHAQAFGAGTTD